MRDSHSRCGLVASFLAAMFAQGDVEALVYGRLIGVVVVGKQCLLELALVSENSLKIVTKKWLTKPLFTDIH